MTEQNQLRRDKQSLRRAMPEDLRLDAADAIAQRLVNSPAFRRAKHIGCYLAWGTEVDTAPLIEHIWTHNKVCYLPVLVPAHQNRLWFAPFYPDTVLKKNRYGIYEPTKARKRRIAPQRLDAVLVPLVAFDRHGTRIGMGGGYYDRTFAFRRTRAVWIQPLLVGLAYECQKAATIPTHPWDVRLDVVVTEETTYGTSLSARRQTR